MEVVTLPFDVPSNTESTFMYGRRYALSVERIIIEFAEGSSFDEITILALSENNYWVQPPSGGSYPSSSDAFNLRFAGDAPASSPVDGGYICFFDFSFDTSLSEIRTPASNYLVPAFPIKLLSPFSITYDVYPFLRILTEKRSIASISKPGIAENQISDMGLIFRPLATKVKGSNIDISYGLEPVIAHASAAFSILITYVNKTTINKRCKVTIFSRPLPPNATLITGAIVNPPIYGERYQWWSSTAPKGDYKRILDDTTQYGPLYPPILLGGGFPALGFSYDYFGGILSLDGDIYLIPFNGARNGRWRVFLTSPSSSPATYTYSTGKDPSEFAPAAAYRGAVVTDNNEIFLCPYAQASHTSGKWHYINAWFNVVNSYDAPILTDHEDDTIEKEPGGYDKFPAYCGGVYVPSGKVILAPYGRSQYPTWHYIDTNAKVVHTYSVTSPPPKALAYKQAYYNIENNYVIYAPTAASSTRAWHYLKVGTMATGTYTVALPPSESNGADFWGITGLLSPNNESLLLPYRENAVKKMVIISHGTAPTTRLVPVPEGYEYGKYIKGVVSHSGRLFLIPGRAKGGHTWQYMNYPPDTHSKASIVTYDEYTSLFDEYTDAVMTYWGDIYLIHAFTRELLVGETSLLQYIRSYGAKIFDQTMVSSPEIDRL